MHIAISKLEKARRCKAIEQQLLQIGYIEARIVIVRILGNKRVVAIVIIRHHFSRNQRLQVFLVDRNDGARSLQVRDIY